MNVVADILGMAQTLLMFALVGAGVMKLFQIATDLREMKDAVHEIRRNSQDHIGPVAAPAYAVASGGAPTPEELVRAVHARSYGDDAPL